MRDWSAFIRKKVNELGIEDISFTKNKLLDWLARRNRYSIQEMKEELLNLKNLVYVEKQVIVYKGNDEERFKCYFVCSGSKGRCYIIKFNHKMGVITVFPLGRTTLKRYKKRFK